MNTKFNAFPIMVNHYSKLFGVEVRMQGTSAYTNGKVITIPRLDINDPVKARLAYGYLAHEAAHVRYTDFEILNDKKLKNDRLLFSLLNILEDSRIEAIIAKEYIGVYENLSLLNDYYEKEWLEFLKNLKSETLLRIILCFIQCYIQCYMQGFLSSRKRASLLFWYLRRHFSHQCLKQIINLCLELIRAEDTKAVYKIAQAILKLLKDHDYVDYESTNKKDSNEQKSSFTQIKAKFDESIGNKSFDISDITPSKNAQSIIEQCCGNDGSSSREDLGLFLETECQRGDENFLASIENTYPLRQSLNLKVRGFVDALAFHCKKGRVIDARCAQKIRLGETSIFKDKVYQSDFATSFHVLVDVSSSMLTTDGHKNTRAQEACKVALMLCSALSGIDGIRVMATFFPGINSEYEIALRSHEKLDLVAPRFDQAPRGSTPLAQAFWYAFEQCQKEHTSRNIILVITDGIPDSVLNVKKCFSFAKERNIEIYGISIRSEIIKDLFENSVVLESARELQSCAFELVSKLFDNNAIRKLHQDLDYVF